MDKLLQYVSMYLDLLMCLQVQEVQGQHESLVDQVNPEALKMEHGKIKYT